MLALVLIVYVLLHAGNTLILRVVALDGLATPYMMVLRSLGCLFCVGVYSYWKQHGLRPNLPRIQGMRMVLAGASLFLITGSYHFIHGTTVAIISRMDIAILILLSFWVGEPKSLRQKQLAALVMTLFLGFALWRNGLESLTGYALAFVGTVGLSLGFLLIKASSSSENESVIVGVPALATLMYGTVAILWIGTPVPVNWYPVALAWLSGPLMFWIYLLTLYLYRRMSVVSAEYPTLFAVPVVLALEFVFLNIELDWFYLSFILVSVVSLGLILSLDKEGSVAVRNNKPTTLTWRFLPSFFLGRS